MHLHTTLLIDLLICIASVQVCCIYFIVIIGYAIVWEKAMRERFFARWLLGGKVVWVALLVVDVHLILNMPNVNIVLCIVCIITCSTFVLILD